MYLELSAPRSSSGGYDVLKICAVRMSVNTLVVEVALIGFAGSDDEAPCVIVKVGIEVQHDVVLVDERRYQFVA